MLAVLLVGLQGCAPLPLINGETLYVMVVSQARLAWLKHSALDEPMKALLLEEFQRLYPNVHVSVLSIREDQLEEELRVRSSRGLGPDLILLRAPMANTLLKEGLIAPVPNTAAMRSSLAQVAPRFLSRVGKNGVYAGLPIYDEVTLACYNRRKILSPPRTTADLEAMAASGRTIGLSIDPFGLWWTASTRGAENALVSILLGHTSAHAPTLKQDEAKIASWLAWLRELAIQSKVDIASGPEELTNGLIEGRLDWIPCFSLTLGLLKQGMGDNLGVTTLPSGPDGPPSPFNSLQVWAFGLDSSPRQREKASAFATLSVNPVLQRRFVLTSKQVLPVNSTVQTPIASSGVLAALAAAQQQFEAGSPLITTPFTVKHLSSVARELEAVVQRVMVGTLTPDEGARILIQLRRRPG